MAQTGQKSTGAEVASKEIASGDQTREVRYPPTEAEHRYEATFAEPQVFRRPDNLHGDDPERMLEKSLVLARRARDAFKEACETIDQDQGEASFLAARQKLDELWDYANLRDRPFRDLLALLTAVIRSTELESIPAVKRDVLRQAFADLPTMFLRDDVVEQHIESFAEHGLDEILDPIRPPKNKRLRITIEEVE